ncbi:MAG: hypothetical protein HYX34_00045 [Actinobacteria bacterium]|nr:hypothetical protein [Actinomycetota bacterium]
MRISDDWPGLAEHGRERNLDWDAGAIRRQPITVVPSGDGDDRLLLVDRHVERGQLAFRSSVCHM